MAPRVVSDNRWRFVHHVVVVLGTVGLITLLCWRLLHVNATTSGFAYLIAVLFIAAGWGLCEALVASVVSVLCLNFFFFEPIGTFNVADPGNWVALLSFFVTSVFAKRLDELLDAGAFPHVHPDEGLDLALDRMGANQIDMLPVVSRADVHNLNGIVTLRDVLDSYGVSPPNWA